MESLPIRIPPVPEQIEIFRILQVWDRAIDLTEQLIAEKRLCRNGLMQQLLTGKRRLKGFKGAWKTVKVRDVLSERKEKMPKSEEEPLYSLTIEKGVTPKTDRYDREALVKDAASKNYKRVCPNDLVYNPANLRWGAIALNKEKFTVLVSPIYEVLFVKNPVDTEMRFIALTLCSDREIARFATQTEGSLVERMAVKIEPFLSTKVDVPTDLNEQRAVADFFDKVDRELDLLRAKADALHEQKKGLMQQLLTGKKRVKV